MNLANTLLINSAYKIYQKYNITVQLKQIYLCHVRYMLAQFLRLSYGMTHYPLDRVEGYKCIDISVLDNIL